MAIVEKMQTTNGSEFENHEKGSQFGNITW